MSSLMILTSNKIFDQQRLQEAQWMKPVLTNESLTQSKGTVLTNYAYSNYANQRERQSSMGSQKRSHFLKGSRTFKEDSFNGEISISQMAGMSQKRNILAPANISVAENSQDTLLHSVEATPIREGFKKSSEMAFRSMGKSELPRQGRREVPDLGINSVKVLDRRASDQGGVLRLASKKYIKPKQYVLEVDQVREKNNKYISTMMSTKNTFSDAMVTVPKYTGAGSNAQNRAHELNGAKSAFRTAATQSLLQNVSNSKFGGQRGSTVEDYNSQGQDRQYTSGVMNCDIEITSLNMHPLNKQQSQEKDIPHFKKEQRSPALQAARIRQQSKSTVMQKSTSATRSLNRTYYDANNYQHNFFGSKHEHTLVNKMISGKANETKMSPDQRLGGMEDAAQYFRSEQKHPVKLRDVLKKGIHDYLAEPRIDESYHLNKPGLKDSRSASRKNLQNLSKPQAELSSLPLLGENSNKMAIDRKQREIHLSADFRRRELNTQSAQQDNHLTNGFEMNPSSTVTLPYRNENHHLEDSPPVMSKEDLRKKKSSLRSFSNNKTSLQTMHQGAPEVFRGAYELSQHEHRLQNKLQSHLKKHRKAGGQPASVLGSTKGDFQSIRSSIKATNKSKSVLTSDKKQQQMRDGTLERVSTAQIEADEIIEEELKRLKRNTINLQKEQRGPKYKLFYNPKFFDCRFDKQGNLLPERGDFDSIPAQNEHESSQKSLTKLNKSGDFSPSRTNTAERRSQSNLNQSKASLTGSHERREAALTQTAGTQSSPGRQSPAQTAEGTKVVNFQASTQDSIRKEAIRKKNQERKKAKERELLYRWAPGTKMGPFSDKFKSLISRYTDEDARKVELINQQRSRLGERFREQHLQHQEQNALRLQRRERRLLKADQAERKRKLDEARGLRRVKDVATADPNDDSESVYLSSNSDDQSEDSETKEEELEDIFDQNEVQVHAMLAEAFVQHGENIDKGLAGQLDMEDKPMEITDKQRIRCMLMIQTFFSGLGDSSEIPLRDQMLIAKRAKMEFDQQKKESEAAEKARIRFEHESRKKSIQEMNERPENDDSSIRTAQEGEQFTASEKDQVGSDGELSTSRVKKLQGGVQDINQKIDIDTNTMVNIDPQGKRQKMEEAVRKILLYKDMRASEHKGEMDDKVKLNQEYIKDTIASYSGQISLPTNIVKKTMYLHGYFLGEGVCQSLSTYFNGLTSNHIQELNLDGNGLRDSTMAILLQGITEKRALRTLSYSDNELGRQTAEEISKMLFWPNPTHLETLKLGSLKTNNFALAILLSALKTNRKLITLDIEKISLNNTKIFEYLCMFLKSNKVIKNLRLSWNAFFPKQIIDIMNHIKRRKTIQYLDLSYNNLVSDKRKQHLVRDFVNTMRRFILRTQIFHLNLMGMNMGKTVTKLVHSMRASSTLNCVHLDMNNVPAEIVYDMDVILDIPETHSNKLNKFRPFKNGEGKQEPSTLQTHLTMPNYGNVGGRNQISGASIGSRRSSAGSSQPGLSKQDSMEELQEEKKQPSLKDDLIEELKRIQDINIAKREKRKLNGKEPKMKKKQEMVVPVMQMPLVYQRILNHPEFVFPLYFKAKQGHQKESFADKVLSQFVQKLEEGENGGKESKQQVESNLDPRQDTVYYGHEFTNGWSKIEALTTKQIRAGKKGVQPDFTGGQGREGIVHTFHDTCWVCEKRKYVLMAVSTDPSKQKNTWGTPITSKKEQQRLMKKYLPNGQMPGRLNRQPICFSSMNDWFPVHLMPVATFAMLFDYTLVQDIAKDKAMKRDTQDSVQKFKEGYEAVIKHAQGTNKMDSSSLRLYKAMWRNYILKNLLYPHDTLFIDFPAPDQEVDADYLFMWAGFVKPGKHRSLLYNPDEDVWYRRDFFVDERETELPNFATYENILLDQDNALESILSEWRVDTPEILQKCLEHDEDNWRINNRAFIKDPTEYYATRQLIENQMHVLKEVFLHTASHDAFPYITMFGTEEFATNAGLIDNKHVKKDAVNRNFIAANVSKQDHDLDAKGQMLCRYEFIEFLVRLAVFKYKETMKVTKTAHESFKRIMDEHIVPFHATHCQDWQLFRNKYLKGTIIDHVMYCNKKGLETIFTKYAQLTKNKVFTQNQAFDIAVHLKINLNDTAVRYCWGMCQSTVEQETKKQGQYNKVTFVEFIEFLCRMLYLRFSMDLDANLLGPKFSQITAERSPGKDKIISELPVSGIPTSSVSSGMASAVMTSRRQMLQDEEEKQEQHQKHLYAYKEFICKTLDPFFDANLLEFIDPDEDVILSDSIESDFEYDLPEGYDSQDLDNPELIPVLTSGSEQLSDEEAGPESTMLDFDALSNRIMHQINKPKSHQSIHQQHDNILRKQKTRRQNKMLLGSATTSTVF